MTYHPDQPMPLQRRRRLWPLVVPIFVLVAIGAGWVGMWYFAAARTQTALDAWRDREAKAGRIYKCERQTIGGFPFRFELTCENPTAQFLTNEPPVSLRFTSLVARAQLSAPTTFTTEFVGPLAIEPAGMPALRATWAHAQADVHGLPTSPESIAISLDNAAFSRADAGAPTLLMQSDHIMFEAVMASGTVYEKPVLEIKMQLAKVMAPAMTGMPLTPEMIALTYVPVDFDAQATVRGLSDLQPKPAPVALRDWQAAGGTLDVTSVRLQQGDIIGRASGRVGLSPRGAPDGQLALVVANFEKLVPALGIDRLMQQSLSQSNLSRMGLGGLDRLLPGLSNVLANNAGPIAQAGLGMMGRPAELEGRKALALPLRFSDGDVILGPVKVAQIPPVY